MNRGILMSVLLGILFCTSLVSAQDPNTYIIQGRQQLFDGTLAGARQSYETFTDGISAFPDNSEIRFFHALSGLVMLGIGDDGDPANSFLELAEKFNLTIAGDTWKDGYDNIIFEVLLNSRGVYEIPPDAPNSEEIGTILSTMAGQVDLLIADVNSLDSSFVVYLDPNETSVFSDPYLPKLTYDIEVDYSDVLILKVILMGLKVQLQGQQAYNLSIDSDGINETAKQIYGGCFKINDLLENYPDLLKVMPVTGKTLLTEAKQNLIDGINYYLDAVDHIKAETDSQENDFLYIDPNNEFSFNNFNNMVITLRDSLVNNTVATIPLDTTKTYNIKYSNGTAFGQFIWKYNTFGSSSAHDISLITDNPDLEGLAVDDIYFESGNILRIDFIYDWWIPAYFEATLASNGNSFTNGTLEYYDPDSSSWNTYASGLTGTLAGSSVVENLQLNLNPLYGSSTYTNPVNPRDLLPQFDEWNGAVRSTIGHGLSNDATLGGILPGKTQNDWNIEFGLTPAGLVTLQSKTATVDGSTNEWTSTYLVFDDITGDTEDIEDPLTGVDIDNLYMSYSTTYLYGAITLKDNIDTVNGYYTYELCLPYQSGKDNTTHSIVLYINKYSGETYSSLYQCTTDSTGYEEWTEIDPGLQVAFGDKAIEFRITRSAIPCGIPGRFIHVSSDCWNSSNYHWDADRNYDTHLKIAGLGTNSLGTISGTITYENHVAGRPIYVWACTDIQNYEVAKDNIIAATMLDAPGDYTLTGLGIGLEGYVVAFSPKYSFNIFDSNNPIVQASRAVTVSGSLVDNIDLTLEGTSTKVAFASSSSSGSENVNGVLTVNLSEEPNETVTVNYTITGGTASGSGVDYTLASGTLTFEPNTTTQNISLTVINDSIDEADETIIVTLSNPSNANLGAQVSHTYTILDDELPPSVEFDISDSNGLETVAAVTLPVSLSAASGKTITVAYSATGGTATGDSVDYTLASGTLTFVPGDTSEDISITIEDEIYGEADETIIVTLSNPTNAVLGVNTSYTYTIINDDLPTVDFSQSSSSGPESESPVTIEVTCLPAMDTTTAVVSYTVTGGTATGDAVDYTLASGTLTFVPGDTSEDISLTITNDDVQESDETIIITLSSPVNASLGNNKSHTYTILNDDDQTDPYTDGYIPEPNATQIARDTVVRLHIKDAMIASTSGVDVNTVQIALGSVVIYDGAIAEDGIYVSAIGTCICTGSEADKTFVLQPTSLFDYQQKVEITVYAEDKSGNPVSESYYFYTVMRSFGQNAKVNSDTGSLAQDNPATAMDSSGNIYVVWDQTAVSGGADIYIGKLTNGDSSFGASTPVYAGAGEHSRPVIAIGSDNTLYIAWQGQPVGGLWDIYVSKSTNSTTWSEPNVVNLEVDPNNTSSQTLPAIAIDQDVTDTVYIVYEDNNGVNNNKDIWVTSSTNGTTWALPKQITTDTSDQTEPAITINNHVACVGWTDARNVDTSTDIYGASSEYSWAEEKILTTENNQSSVVLVTDPSEEDVYEFWVDDANGYDDIYYGMDEIDDIGTSITDEPGKDKSQPTAAAGSSSKLFAAWTDFRNVKNNSDTDIYFTESGSSGFEDMHSTLVNDDTGINAQANPVINVDINGNPYLVWVDSRNGNKDIYYAGATYVSDPVPTTILIESSTITVKNSTVLKVTIPKTGALPTGFDVNDITIAQLMNPPQLPPGSFGVCYDFGPSGLTFSEPVTITMPHDADYLHYDLFKVYWYNAETDTWSQTGISNVQHHIIDSSTHTVSFETTHFTSYAVGSEPVYYGGGGGGGGCTMSQYPQTPEYIAGYFLPYVVYILILLTMSYLYKRKRNADNKN